LDPVAHAELASLLLRFSPRAGGLAIEALAARLLAPEAPGGWRLWAHVQVANDHHGSAFASLNRYVELAGGESRVDPEDRTLLGSLRASLPGGALAQRELRRRPTPR